jgi:peroxiredoxin
VVAISVDGVEDNRRVVEKLGLEFPVLSDSSRQAIAAYGVVHEGGGVDGGAIARPAVLLVGPEGRILWRDITHNWRIRVHPDTVVEAVRNAG